MLLKTFSATEGISSPHLALVQKIFSALGDDIFSITLNHPVTRSEDFEVRIIPGGKGLFEKLLDLRGIMDTQITIRVSSEIEEDTYGFIFTAGSDGTDWIPFTLKLEGKETGFDYIVESIIGAISWEAWQLRNKTSGIIDHVKEIKKRVK